MPEQTLMEAIEQLETIDLEVAKLVLVLNALPGVSTFSSCGGHHPTGPCQSPAGRFMVNFYLVGEAEGEESAAGLRSLRRVVEALQAVNDEADGECVIEVHLWADSGLNFELRGSAPYAEILANRLLATPDGEEPA